MHGALSIVGRVKPNSALNRSIYATDPADSKSERKATSWTIRLNELLLDANQETVYDSIAVESTGKAVTEYTDCSFVCFGGVRSGKSYTAMGPSDDYNYRGLVPRVLEDVFSILRGRASSYSFNVYLSSFIVDESGIHDLSTIADSANQTDNVRLLQVGSDIKGLHRTRVLSYDDALHEVHHYNALLENRERHGPRPGHKVFSVTIEQRALGFQAAQSDDSALDSVKYRTYTSRIDIVEMSSIVRVLDSPSSAVSARHRLRNNQILFGNSSLSALERVIITMRKFAATKKTSSGPKESSDSLVRDNDKLVRYLMRALMHGRVTIVPCVDLRDDNTSEVLSVLRSAQNMMKLESTIQVHSAVSNKEVIASLQEQIRVLQMELAARDPSYTSPERKRVSPEEMKKIASDFLTSGDKSALEHITSPSDLVALIHQLRATTIECTPQRIGGASAQDGGPLSSGHPEFSTQPPSKKQLKQSVPTETPREQDSEPIEVPEGADESLGFAIGIAADSDAPKGQDEVGLDHVPPSPKAYMVMKELSDEQKYLTESDTLQAGTKDAKAASTTSVAPLAVQVKAMIADDAKYGDGFGKSLDSIKHLISQEKTKQASLKAECERIFALLKSSKAAVSAAASTGSSAPEGLVSASTQQPAVGSPEAKPEGTTPDTPSDADVNFAKLKTEYQKLKAQYSATKAQYEDSRTRLTGFENTLKESSRQWAYENFAKNSS